MLNSPCHQNAYKYISHDFTPSLSILQDASGNFVTHPKHVDKLLIDSWEKVYNGNSSHHAHTVASYLHKYSSYLFMSCPTTLPPLTTHDLYATIHDTTNSAGGMCSWTYAEWKLLPEFVFTHIVCMLNLIEGGAPWPQQVLHAKAHPLSKDPQ
eukprot:12420886-Karenia_brevis.AAC.1